MFGCLNPLPLTKSATPTIAPTAATKNIRGNHERDHMLSRIGVKIMVKEIIKPALVADVILIPLVSICMIVPTATP